MGTVTNEGNKSFIAAATLAANRLVKLTAANTVNYAGVGEEDAVIGVTLHDVTSGDLVSVKPIGQGGTSKVTASAAITVNLELNCAANGMVAANGSETDRIGRALQAATGANHVIEAMLGYAVAG